MNSSPRSLLSESSGRRTRRGRSRGETVRHGVVHGVGHGAAVELDVAGFAINGVRVRNVALADPLDPCSVVAV
eukprot:4896253-Pyramimonas_sp.AAC.1